MADVHSKAVRSFNMSRVRSKATQIETTVSRLLHKMGYRYRLNVRRLPGSPDIVLSKRNAVLFVHGCFWHAHSCHLFKPPKTRKEFWTAKVSVNRARDERAIKGLLGMGWRVGVVWECAIRGTQRLTDEDIAAACDEWLKSDRLRFELHGK